MNDDSEAELSSAPDQDKEQRPTTSKSVQFTRMAAEVDELFQGALQTEGPAAFDSYLDTICRLRHLSAFNALLVQAQRPGVSWVATSQQWRRKGRRVLPGALPIVILRPFGPVLFIYEATDTDGPPIDSIENSVFTATGHASESDWQQMSAKAQRLGVKVVLTQYGSRVAGTAQGVDEFPSQHLEADTRWLVRVNSSFDLPTRIATLAHELGHIYCGHCGADPHGRWWVRRPTSHAVRELEAEAVAWLACRRLGLAPRSREYLSSLATPSNIGAVSVGLGMLSIIRACELVEHKRMPFR